MLMYLGTVCNGVLLCAIVCTVTHRLLNKSNQLSLSHVSTKVHPFWLTVAPAFTRSSPIFFNIRKFVGRLRVDWQVVQFT
ncbi:hypothetical protein PFLUV_G00199670 [Perca fluviatilis]|uniref:Uncharacterized protein n=1 Tax=Perca fluviatilis TaxID=8168 RepID=A0A6A5EE65_PERFL|nr:hypothetical protein PFLUV_G00199670 [Perca fluviatilis]